MDEHNEGEYTVLVNAEEQYSIWRTALALPEGWREVGKRGGKGDCLAYVDETWTDLRPLTLRRRMAGGTAS
ncbi:MbtH family NRPS accessory protein [Streptomyces sp. NPDC047014]|uniref:MbtH family protein n=1 Tax=Streptomyces sp. NPDC047014 TaxID=3155736 RepID=UPI0033C6F666